MTGRPRMYFVAYSNQIRMMADIKALRDSGQGRPEQWQIVSATKPAEELYDSRTDPHEVVNLAADPGQASRLARHSHAERIDMAARESIRDSSHWQTVPGPRQEKERPRRAGPETSRIAGRTYRLLIMGSPPGSAGPGQAASCDDPGE